MNFPFVYTLLWSSNVNFINNSKNVAFTEWILDYKKNQIRINYLERNMSFDGYLIHSFALRGWIVPITTKMENV